MPVIPSSPICSSPSIPETVDPEFFPAKVPIDRGEIVTEVEKRKRPVQADTRSPKSGVSPRVLPGTADTMYIAATDDHDETGVLISDVFCNPAVRRKVAEKRMKKMDLALRDLPAPKLVGPAGAQVTLIGWGSSEGMLHEAAEQLNASGVSANQLQFKYLLPFHSREAIDILSSAASRPFASR